MQTRCLLASSKPGLFQRPWKNCFLCAFITHLFSTQLAALAQLAHIFLKRCVCDSCDLSLSVAEGNTRAFICRLRCHGGTVKMWRLCVCRNVTFDSADWSRLLHNWTPALGSRSCVRASRTAGNVVRASFRHTSASHHGPPTRGNGCRTLRAGPCEEFFCLQKVV